MGGAGMHRRLACEGTQGPAGVKSCVEEKLEKHQGALPHAGTQGLLKASAGEK